MYQKTSGSFLPSSHVIVREALRVPGLAEQRLRAGLVLYS